MRWVTVLLLSAMAAVAPVSAQPAPSPGIDPASWHTIGLRFWEFEGCTLDEASCHTTRFEAGVWVKNEGPFQWFYAWQWQSWHDFAEAGTINDFQLTYRSTDLPPYTPNTVSALVPTVCNDPLNPCVGLHHQTDMVAPSGAVASDQFWLITLDNTIPLALDISVLFENGGTEQTAMSLVRSGRVVSEPSPLVLLVLAGLALFALRRRTSSVDRVPASPGRYWRRGTATRHAD